MRNVCCPLCGSKLGSVVQNTKPFGGPPFAVRRLRRCAACLGRWATIELKITGGVFLQDILKEVEHVTCLHTDVPSRS
jgi:transcriptional regulator NrdR family protein